VSDRASIDIEQIVLGSLLANEDDGQGATPADSYLGLLRVEDFETPAHRATFSAIKRVADAGGPLSIESVILSLQEIRALNAVGESYVRDLPISARSAKDLAGYIDKLRVLARARRLGKAAELAAKFYASNVGAEEFLARAGKLLSGAIEDDSIGAEFESAQQGLERVAEDCEKRQPLVAYFSGFEKLDLTIGGFQPGSLNIVAARPGVGKTSYAANLAVNIAMVSKVPAMMFSLEMPAEQIWQRIMSSLSGVAHDAIRRRDTGPDELAKIYPVAQLSQQLPFYIHKPRRGRPDAQEMAAAANAFKRKYGGLSVVIVDYIQLALRDGRDPVEQRTAEISNGLKTLAMDLGCAVLALSQLNRESAKDDARPTMSQLRYSGAIEQDADSVMLLWRPKPGTKGEDGNQLPDGYTEVIIDKNRHGPTGRVEMRFIEWLTRFEEAEARDQQQGSQWDGEDVTYAS
jgi:replicative DNA helicase